MSVYTKPSRLFSNKLQSAYGNYCKVGEYNCILKPYTKALWLGGWYVYFGIYVPWWGGGIGGTFTVKFMYHNEWGEGQGDVIEYSWNYECTVPLRKRFLTLNMECVHYVYHYMSLKGVFAKNEKGYRLNVIKKRFSSLLILLLLRLLENCWRRLLPNNLRKLQFTTWTVKNQFNFKQVIQILQPIVIDYFSPHLYFIIL